MSKFIGDLIVKVLVDDADGMFQLVQPFSFQSDVAGRTFTAPVGTKTDFCSTPLVGALKDDKFRKSGTIHDWLYESKTVERETADSVLKEMLLCEGASEIEAETYYLAVREFGGSHY